MKGAKVHALAWPWFGKRYDRRTACGLPMRRVLSSENAAEVTCKWCLRSHNWDRRVRGIPVRSPHAKRGQSGETNPVPSEQSRGVVKNITRVRTQPKRGAAL